MIFYLYFKIYFVIQKTRHLGHLLKHQTSPISLIFSFYFKIFIFFKIHFLCLLHLHFFHRHLVHLLPRPIHPSLVHLFFLLQHLSHILRVESCWSNHRYRRRVGVSLFLVWILRLHQLLINKYFLLIKYNKRREIFYIRLRYIHCFPSLNDSICAKELIISAQRKTTKIKSLIFIFDQLRVYCIEIWIQYAIIYSDHKYNRPWLDNIYYTIQKIYIIWLIV